LTFALSGGRLGHSASSEVPRKAVSIQPNKSSDKELHALQSWGELCLGLAVPRGGGKNLESAISINYEIVRIMLECGIVHALMYAAHRVPTSHQMASSTLGTLLLPLELLTRPSVSDFVSDLVKKEKSSPAKDTSSSAVAPDPHIMLGASDQGRANQLFLDAVEDEQSVDEDGDDMVEVEDENDNSEEESIDDDNDDEEISEDEQSENSEDISDDEESDSSSDDDDDDDDDEAGEEIEDEGAWDLDYDHTFGLENPQANAEDGDEQGERPAGIDEGWTRIDSTAGGAGGVFAFNGGGGAEGDGDRARGFMDAAEAMIGTLLRSGEINARSVAEIENQLGIRIFGGGSRNRLRQLGAPAGAGAEMNAIGDALGFRGVGGRSESTTQRRGNSDLTGTLPHVHQRSQPESGYSGFGGTSSGRLTDISSLEIVFGGPSVTSGSRNYDTVAPREEQDDEQVQLPHITQLDLHLFPGGPASAATARTQHSLHPLLCGVDLPPINSLVTDLLPHGARARRSSQTSARRSSDWSSMSTFTSGGYLVSTSNGNIIRSSRSHAGDAQGTGLPTRNIAGPIGWIDDGLPFDATVEQLSSTLQTELTRSLREQAETAASERSAAEAAAAAAAAEEAAHSNTASSNDGTSPETQETLEDAPASSSSDDNGTANDEAPVAMDTTESTEDRAEQSVSSPLEVAGRDDDAPSMGSEGERVTSSLANGLRLSPSGDAQESNAESNPEAASTNNQENENGVSPSATDSADPADTTTDVMEEEPVRSSQNDESQETTTDNADRGTEEENRNNMEVEEGGGSLEQEGLTCPPGIDPEAFNCLPREMQLDIVREHSQSQELAAELEGTSLDPEVLAELPEDVRRDVIEQSRRERSRGEETAPADPARAAELDNASFIATLPPELRADVLLTADEETLNNLPPDLIAEANVLRTRAAEQQHQREEAQLRQAAESRRGGRAASSDAAASSSRRKLRTGKIKAEIDREKLIYMPNNMSSPFAKCDLQLFLQLFFLVSPVRPQRLLQKVLQNLCGTQKLRSVVSNALLQLLHENREGAGEALNVLSDEYSKGSNSSDWRVEMDALFDLSEAFPPQSLIGVAPIVPQTSELDSFSAPFIRHKQGLGAAASVVANLPKSSRGSVGSQELPPVVGSRLIDSLQQMCKHSPRFCIHSLAFSLTLSKDSNSSITCFESMTDLLRRPPFLRAPARLDQLLSLLETVVAPLSSLPRGSDEEDAVPKKELDAATASGKEWTSVPAIEISPERLQALCSILRMESCRDTAFARVNTILRRLCRVDSNRRHVLAELASVAQTLGEDAIRDLKALKIRMEEAAMERKVAAASVANQGKCVDGESPTEAAGKLSSTVTFSTSTSELKLLRVLQTLQAMCSDSGDEGSSKKEGIYVTEELIDLLRQLEFGALWDELSSCLSVVQVLEGVSSLSDQEEKGSEDADTPEEASADADEVSGERSGKKKLRNSSAGLLARFLPSIEAFFVATASTTKPKDSDKTSSSSSAEDGHGNIVGSKRLIDFVTKNRVLLNALVRNNSSILDRGMRALVQVPQCRVVLDFDVKRQWFKTQVRRLRQHASRRHGNIRLHINRKNVFEEAYHSLRVRTADEMRGRLQITFRNEEGIDAGGLSREFFAILAKEMFNPNYALFTSTEDGCTFQPNPNSNINPDHLSYFRFVGRIVGKAVADGYLLDAHFTRSLYKHMLGIKPSHQDMEAIDPDYYRNLKTILDFKLEDIGLELFFSTTENSFGRNTVIDLKPGGRKLPVTEENKEEYVQLVCEHRMTTAIQRQIKSYLDGFYELVNPDLIAIFTPRELELVISGLPDIDVADLKKNTEYVGWKATDKEIGWFWAVMGNLTRNQKAAFLQFVTGSSKVPLAGFGELQGMRGIQKFSIHKATTSSKGSLMSAHTCFNSLDLPVYESEEEMREKLLYAINEGAGSFQFG